MVGADGKGERNKSDARLMAPGPRRRRLGKPQRIGPIKHPGTNTTHTNAAGRGVLLRGMGTRPQIRGARPLGQRDDRALAGGETSSRSAARAGLGREPQS